jgi:hypothetical protein
MKGSSMLDFDRPPVSFKVKGEVYHVSSVTLEDAAQMTVLADASVMDQVAAMQKLLAEKVSTPRSRLSLWLRRKPSPRAALASLSAIQQAQLFGEWMSEWKARGVVPGESSGSAD